MIEMTSGTNQPKIMRNWQMNELIGKVMLIVETMGLQKGQEESAKSLIKQAMWREFNEGFDIEEGPLQEAVAKSFTAAAAATLAITTDGSVYKADGKKASKIS